MRSSDAGVYDRRQSITSFGLIIHHTDAQREYAYDAKPSSSGKLITALEAAADRGWTVVDMQKTGGPYGAHRA